MQAAVRVGQRRRAVLHGVDERGHQRRGRRLVAVGLGAVEDDLALVGLHLDAEHVPTLRRLVDYYWELGDDANVTDIAKELQQLDVLFDTETTRTSWARIAIAAACRRRRVSACG